MKRLNQGSSSIKQKKALKSDMNFLRYIGFDSFDTSEINSTSFTLESKKPPGINLSDFWSKSEKERFMKRTGTIEAYNQLKKQHELKKIQYSHNILKPDKPYIMNINMKRRTIFKANREWMINHMKKSLKTKLYPPVHKTNPTEVDNINMACYSLYCQNERLRSQNHYISEKLKYQFQNLGQNIPCSFKKLLTESRKAAEKNSRLSMSFISN